MASFVFAEHQDKSHAYGDDLSIKMSIANTTDYSSWMTVTYKPSHDWLINKREIFFSFSKFNHYVVITITDDYHDDTFNQADFAINGNDFDEAHLIMGLGERERVFNILRHMRGKGKLLLNFCSEVLPQTYNIDDRLWTRIEDEIRTLSKASLNTDLDIPARTPKVSGSFSKVLGGEFFLYHHGVWYDKHNNELITVIVIDKQRGDVSLGQFLNKLSLAIDVGPQWPKYEAPRIKFRVVDPYKAMGLLELESEVEYFETLQSASHSLNQFQVRTVVHFDSIKKRQ